MALFQLQSNQIPKNPPEWTEGQRMQYQFGGERYSMRGVAGDRPSHIVKQFLKRNFFKLSTNNLTLFLKVSFGISSLLENSAGSPL